MDGLDGLLPHAHSTSNLNDKFVQWTFQRQSCRWGCALVGFARGRYNFPANDYLALPYMLADLQKSDQTCLSMILCPQIHL